MLGRVMVPRESWFIWLALFLWVGSAQLIHPFPVGVRFFFITPLLCFLIFIGLYFPSRVPIVYRGIALFLVAFGVIIVQHFLPVLAGPDERAFYHSVTNNSWTELISLGGDRFDLFSVGIIPSGVTFPIVVKFVLGGLIEMSERTIVFMNWLIWMIAAFSWVRAVDSRWGLYLSLSKNNLGWLFVLLLALPSVVYWSSVFSKDILAVSLTVLAATNFVGKRYILMGLFFLTSIAIRSYAPFGFLVFVGFLLASIPMLLFAVFLGAVLLFVLTGGSISAFINLGIMSGYSVLSPNPFLVENWRLYVESGSWVFSPILFTVEAVLIASIAAIGVGLAVLKWDSLRIFVLVGLAIIAFSAILTAVGFISFKGDSYSVGTLGDNFVRKKLALWPLIVTLLWASLLILFRRIRLLRRGASKNLRDLV